MNDDEGCRRAVAWVHLYTFEAPFLGAIFRPLYHEAILRMCLQGIISCCRGVSAALLVRCKESIRSSSHHGRKVPPFGQATQLSFIESQMFVTYTNGKYEIAVLKDEKQLSGVAGTHPNAITR
jgi:hypothetical protein